MPISTKKQVCLNYLDALTKMKKLCSLDRFPYSCFGTYSAEEDNSCLLPPYREDEISLPCQICMAQVARPSACWIQEMYKNIQKGE